MIHRDTRVNVPEESRWSEERRGMQRNQRIRREKKTTRRAFVNFRVKEERVEYLIVKWLIVSSLFFSLSSRDNKSEGEGGAGHWSLVMWGGKKEKQASWTSQLVGVTVKWRRANRGQRNETSQVSGRERESEIRREVTCRVLVTGFKDPQRIREACSCNSSQTQKERKCKIKGHSYTFLLTREVTQVEELSTSLVSLLF